MAGGQLTFVVEEKFVVALWRGVLFIKLADGDDVLVREVAISVLVFLHLRVLERPEVAVGFFQKILSHLKY